MQHTEPLIEAKFLKRYKRFFADVRLNDGQVVTAHVANTGSLKGCLEPESPCLVSFNDNPARKLKYTLHFLSGNGTWVGVNTSLPNALVFEAWEKKLFQDWQPFAFGKREFKISPESRLDLVLAETEAHFAAREKLHHVEVKNVTFAEGTTAKFPDAVTERGQKHLRVLMALKKAGHGAEIHFVVQRSDCDEFAPADSIDPVYGKLLRQAYEEGVTITARKCIIDPKAGVEFHIEPLPIRL